MHKIDKNGDLLTKLNQTIYWEMFCVAIEEVRDKKRQSNVGPKGYDAILLFKILILQSLYSLSDDATSSSPNRQRRQSLSESTCRVMGKRMLFLLDHVVDGCNKFQQGLPGRVCLLFPLQRFETCNSGSMTRMHAFPTVQFACLL